MKTSRPKEGDAVLHAFERVLDQLAHDPAFAQVELVGHSAQVRRGGARLVVTIDRIGGVDVALCERIAAHVNGQLAELDQSYSLEVESAGLERSLVRPEDYQRFAGKAARVVTTLAIEGAKTHRGTLVGVRGTNVVLAVAGGELLLPIATIKHANVEYDPRADLVRDKRERREHA